MWESLPPVWGHLNFFTRATFLHIIYAEKCLSVDGFNGIRTYPANNVLAKTVEGKLARMARGFQLEVDNQKGSSCPFYQQEENRFHLVDCYKEAS
jgi:hypothetical protein